MSPEAIARFLSEQTAQGCTPVSNTYPFYAQNRVCRQPTLNQRSSLHRHMRVEGSYAAPTEESQRFVL